MNTVNHTLALPVTPPLQSAGRVTHQFPDGSLTVESEGRGWHCRRAASCVIAPELGDYVLIASTDEQLWLLAILERAAVHQPAQLSVEGDLQIYSEGELSLHSQTLRMTAEEGDCHVGTMKYSGESLSAWVSLTRVVGQRAESVWHTVTQISHHLLRKTTHTEQVRAGQLDMKAEDYARLHANNILITSKAITKVDSEQIHMG